MLSGFLRKRNEQSRTMSTKVRLRNGAMIFTKAQHDKMADKAKVPPGQKRKLRGRFFAYLAVDGTVRINRIGKPFNPSMSRVS